MNQNTQHTLIELTHKEGCATWESRMKHISLPQRVKALRPGNGHYEGTALTADGRVIERALSDFGSDRFWVWPSEAAWADYKGSSFDPENARATGSPAGGK